jgi:integrase
MRALIRGSRPELAHADDATIDDQSASLLTAHLIIDYQARVRTAAGGDPVAVNRATTTANSYRRQARSLFARDNLTIYRDLKMPDLADFMGARKLREPRHDYVRVDGELVRRIMDAAPALRTADPNAYRVLVMALGMGLRKREIAFAQWDWLQQETGGRLTLVLRCTDRFRTKTNEPRAVPVPLAVYNELHMMRQAQAQPAGPHFLEGCETERLNTFRRFSAWLQGMGWTRLKKAHELRKMFGTEIHEQAGLASAQKLLGHSSASVTLSHYVDVPNVSLDVLTKFLPHLRAPAQ